MRLVNHQEAPNYPTERSPLDEKNCVEGTGLIRANLRAVRQEVLDEMWDQARTYGYENRLAHLRPYPRSKPGTKRIPTRGLRWSRLPGASLEGLAELEHRAGRGFVHLEDPNGNTHRRNPRLEAVTRRTMTTYGGGRQSGFIRGVFIKYSGKALKVAGKLSPLGKYVTIASGVWILITEGPIEASRQTAIDLLDIDETQLDLWWDGHASIAFGANANDFLQENLDACIFHDGSSVSLDDVIYYGKVRDDGTFEVHAKGPVVLIQYSQMVALGDGTQVPSYEIVIDTDDDPDNKGFRLYLTSLGSIDAFEGLVTPE